MPENPRLVFSQERCKVGVWSIFRAAGDKFSGQSLAENMDLTPFAFDVAVLLEFLLVSCDQNGPFGTTATGLTPIGDSATQRSAILRPFTFDGRRVAIAQQTTYES
jgi:hypothetical protein